MNLKEIGYFSKTHGLKGHLQLQLKTDFDIDNCQALFVEINGSHSPYFIEEYREGKNSFVVLLEDIDVIEKAAKLVGKAVSVDEKLLFADEGNLLLGFMVIDNIKGELGLITEVIDNGINPVIQIKHKDKDLLLPLNQDFIEKLDEKAKILYYKAPEGLIDMYLNP